MKKPSTFPAVCWELLTMLSSTSSPAAIFEFVGAIALGNSVSDTIKCVHSFEHRTLVDCQSALHMRYPI